LEIRLIECDPVLDSVTEGLKTQVRIKSKIFPVHKKRENMTVFKSSYDQCGIEPTSGKLENQLLTVIGDLASSHICLPALGDCHSD